MKEFDIYDWTNTEKIDRDKNWPIVYFLKNDKFLYVGETTNVIRRFIDHGKTPEKSDLNTKIILSPKYSNKSISYLIESDIINRAFADGTYTLLNTKKQSNAILQSHDFYEKKKTLEELPKIWSELVKIGLFNKSYDEIENNELFKYSPWKNFDLNQLDIIDSVTNNFIGNENSFVQGGAGTGKTLLIIRIAMDFVLKDKNNTITIYSAKNGNHNTFRRIVKKLDSYFRKRISIIDNLKKETILKCDKLLIDEGQRLRKKSVNNFSAPSYFKKNLASNEIEWIEKNKINYSIFYDLNQSFHKNDLNLIEYINNNQYDLISQYRMNSGNDYIDFIKEFLQIIPNSNRKFIFGKYNLRSFDSPEELYSKVKDMNKSKGSFDNKSRLLASLDIDDRKWKTKSLYNNAKLSKNTVYSEETSDFKIGSDYLVWNKKSNYSDWLEKSDISEVGCVHTSQGRDFRYAGVLFSNDISFYDNNVMANKSIKHSYFILLTRGIEGTGLFIPNPQLRKRFETMLQRVEFIE